MKKLKQAKNIAEVLIVGGATAAIFSMSIPALIASTIAVEVVKSNQKK